MPQPQHTGGLAPLTGRPWLAVNEVLAFGLEVLALGLLGWWGFATGDSAAVHVLLGIGTPALGILLWALFAAPKARFRPPLAGVLLVKALVLGGSGWALWDLGHPAPAAVLTVVMVANTAVAETFRRTTGPHRT